eukprot:TRINITY_DN32997_c0_g1_i1.p3 TRINITY_DN32997_c0_g1~~TRINITY_DN32997_c0_g1_i1.p3  ORF type:complete len:245 (+),score=93.95 TRINITY_DN32997_c0_g1_i1:68-736(+)
MAAAALAEDVVFAALADFLPPAGLAQVALTRRCFALPASRRILARCEGGMHTLWQLDLQRRLCIALTDAVREVHAAAHAEAGASETAQRCRELLGTSELRRAQSQQARSDFDQRCRIAELCRFNAALASVLCTSGAPAGGGMLARDLQRQQALVLRDSARQTLARCTWVLDGGRGWAPDKEYQLTMWRHVETAVRELWTFCGIGISEGLLERLHTVMHSIWS